MTRLAAILLLMLCLCGCLTENAQRMGAATVAQEDGVLPVPNTVTLTWTGSEGAVAYRVYYSNGSYSRMVETPNTSVSISDLADEPPTTFYATSIGMDGWESAPSESITWPAPPLTNVIIRIIAQSAPLLSGPWVGTNLVLTVTNPPAQMQLWRLVIEKENF